MCGILGTVAPLGKAPAVSPDDVLRMRDTMRARGPDGAGVFHHRNIAFAHRRLAIRDIPGGAQPWLSDDGETVLVYNGELYNDAELRTELTDLGHHFRSTCDTETVLAAWRAWGSHCVERFVGMFALGIYDFRDDTLFLARDPCGVKPLFFRRHDDGLTFASTLPALLADPRYRREPHWPAISHYLTTFRLTLGRSTLYAGIEQLLPGERLLWQHGQVRIDRYWDYPLESSDIGFEEASHHLGELLRQSVRSQLVSDVPVGMFLSGGVDSSTIACLVREAVPTRMVGQCGGGAGDDSPDFIYARRCAAHVDFDHAEVRVEPDAYHDAWDDLLDRYGTPVSTPSDVIIHRLAIEMKRSVGVVLGGEGADEALCGYGVQHWSANDFELSESLRRGRWSGGVVAAQIFQRSLQRCYGRDAFASDVDHYFALNSLIPSAVKPHLLHPEAWAAAGEDVPMRQQYATMLRELPGQSLVQRHQALLHRVNLESLLARLDTATMEASLEARVPYTDHRFVEAAFRLPVAHRIDLDPHEQSPRLAAPDLDGRGSLRTKRVLRSIAERLMPQALAHRRKASFPTPVARWLCGSWSARAREQLLGSRFGRQFFQPQALRDLAGNPAAAGMWLWPLLNVLAWGDRVF